jgi:simple sugar transport system permease protein
MIVGKWHPAGRRRRVPAVRRHRGGADRAPGQRLPERALAGAPYAVTMLALAGFIGRATPPRALGTPYDPEGA